MCFTHASYSSFTTSAVRIQPSPYVSLHRPYESLRHPYTSLVCSYMPRALLLYAPRHGGVWALAHGLAQNIIALDKTLCHHHQRLKLKPHISRIRSRIPFEFDKWLGNT